MSAVAEDRKPPRRALGYPLAGGGAILLGLGMTLSSDLPRGLSGFALGCGLVALGSGRSWARRLGGVLAGTALIGFGVADLADSRRVVGVVLVVTGVLALAAWNLPATPRRDAGSADER